jgi:hypothetical protein
VNAKEVVSPSAESLNRKLAKTQELQTLVYRPVEKAVEKQFLAILLETGAFGQTAGMIVFANLKLLLTIS